VRCRPAAPGGAATACALLLVVVSNWLPLHADEPQREPAPDPAAPAPAAPAAPRETVVVTAPAGEVTTDPSAFGTLVNALDLNEPFLSLPELLRRTVGVQVRSLGGEFATVSIRGSTAEQVVVYLDGVPLNNALGGGVNLADVPLAGLESIEVYRGTTPAFLSSASIGGAILLHSRRPVDGSDSSGFMSIGSYGAAEAGGSWAFARGRGDGMVAIDGGRSDGDYLFFDNNGTPFDVTDDGETARVNNDFRRGHVMARGGWRQGEANVTFGLDLFEREQGVPGFDTWQSTDSRLSTGRMLLHAGAEVPGLVDGRLLLRGLVSRLVQDQEYEGAPGDLGYLTRSTDNRVASTGAEASGTYVLSAHQGVSFLGALRLETADMKNRLPDPSERASADRRIATLTAEDAIELAEGRVVLLPSLRHERWQSSFDPDPASSLVSPSAVEQDTSTTGRLGLRVRLRDGLDLRANAGNYLRLPDLTELYGDQGTIIGNPALRPESGVNADLGLTASVARPGGPFRDLRAQVVVFETRADDLIMYVFNSQSTVVARNLGAARIQGVELSLSFAAGRRFSGSLNAARQWAVDTSATYTNGRQLPLRPRDEISAAAGLVAGRGRVAWEFTYVGPNYTDTANSESGRLPSRYLHDLSYRRPLSAHLEASFEVRNLFDDRTVDAMRFPLPGRAFGARLQWTY
jgi:iron complex outermembrane receptor protein